MQFDAQSGYLLVVEQVYPWLIPVAFGVSAFACASLAEAIQPYFTGFKNLVRRAVVGMLKIVFWRLPRAALQMVLSFCRGVLVLVCWRVPRASLLAAGHALVQVARRVAALASRCEFDFHRWVQQQQEAPKAVQVLQEEQEAPEAVIISKTEKATTRRSTSSNFGKAPKRYTPESLPSRLVPRPRRNRRT